jgi:SAM-dependent methyltransferase
VKESTLTSAQLASPARIAYDACPLCDHEEAAEVGEASCADHPLYTRELPAKMRWIRCDACGHVFVDGYWNDGARELLLRNAHPFQLPGSDTAAGRAVSAKIVEDVSHARGDWTGRWLDVGFGNGALVTTAAEFGYEVVGLDLRPEGVRRLRELGFEAHCVSVDDFEASAPFDVVSMADVLEHMPFPRVALRQAHALLRPGGVLFASMPNIESFAWQELERERKNPYWGELEHFHNFGRRRLYALLEETGFGPVRYGVSQRYLASMEVVARRKPAGVVLSIEQ